MRLKKPFLIALAISFALHLLVISGPAWNLPTLDELLAPDEGAPLEAHLVAHPGPVAVRPARPKHKPVPKRPVPANEKVSRDGTPSVAPPPLPEPVAEPAAEDSPAGPTEAESGPAAPAVKMTLPRFARIEYRVTMGESGFWIGSAVQELRHDETSYSLRSNAETVGLVRLFKPASMLNVSEGDIVASGLRPRRFRIERSNGKNESATLDWEAGEVRLASGRRYPLEPGAQDLLSMFAQLALVGIDGDAVSLPVATGKQVERYDFAVLGEEKINTPRGEQLTLHLRNRQPDGKESTDVWLGLDDARLPIKIRHIDRRGDIFDQIVERIDYEEPKEGTR
jgi:hypothetical protein